MSNQDEQGGRFDVKSGIHSAELRLIQRALRHHMQAATERKARIFNNPLTKEFERQMATDEVAAIVRVSNRLRHELVPHKGDQS